MSTPSYWGSIEAAHRSLADADFVLVGAGAGLSASGGLNYASPALFKAWYPQFAGLGCNSIWEAIVAHWAPDDSNRRRFWAFWAHHIRKIRYELPAADVYLKLRELMTGKEVFVITTNVDGQFFKAGFDPAVVYTPQGDYGMFQCETPCNDALHDNRQMVETLIQNWDADQLLVRGSDIPRCHACGGYLERNLRKDGQFVEAPYEQGRLAFNAFLERAWNGRLVLLEMGVGFNTPGVIRWPFQRIAAKHPRASLLRVNRDDARVPQDVGDGSVGFQGDAATVVGDLAAIRGIRTEGSTSAPAGANSGGGRGVSRSVDRQDPEHSSPPARIPGRRHR
jgi:NAD-dependent SIR2 family protein deacetylase